jgi:hypothetical protein
MEKEQLLIDLVCPPRPPSVPAVWQPRADVVMTGSLDLMGNLIDVAGMRGKLVRHPSPHTPPHSPPTPRHWLLVG